MPEVAVGPLDRQFNRQHLVEPVSIDDTPTAPEYLVGYSMEHGAAWRCILKGDKQTQKEYTTDIKL
eukprot:7273207-Lingulodinium_polyedra.AAC.1